MLVLELLLPLVHLVMLVLCVLLDRCTSAMTGLCHCQCCSICSGRASCVLPWHLLWLAS